MSIEEMLESDDYEIFELCLNLKEKRDKYISIVYRMRYERRIQQKLWYKICYGYEKQLLRGNYKIKIYESK